MRADENACCGDLSQQGVQANAASNNPAISSDGRYVAFSSEATNLVFGDTNGFSDIFVVDSVTGAISRVSVTTAGIQANGANFKPSITTRWKNRPLSTKRTG